MNTEYHNCTCTYVLYVLCIIFNIVCKIVRLIVRVLRKKFKLNKAIKALTICSENKQRNLSGQVWFGVYGSAEYAYAVGAWTLTTPWLLRHYIIETLISELRVTIEPHISRIPDHKRDRKNPHGRDVIKGEIFLT